MIDTIMAAVGATSAVVATTFAIKDRYSKWRTRKRRPRRNVSKSRKR